MILIFRNTFYEAIHAFLLVANSKGGYTFFAMRIISGQGFPSAISPSFIVNRIRSGLSSRFIGMMRVALLPLKSR